MKNKRDIWKYPWGYAESYLIGAAILILGLLLDLFVNVGKINIATPTNKILLIIIVIFTGVIFGISKKKKVLQWFYSSEASIASISIFAIVTMILSLVPEKQLHILGFPDFRYSLTFIFSYSYLIIILGVTVLKRFKFKKIKDIVFFLNHFGLWLVLVAMGAGAGDMQTLNMPINKGDTVWFASDKEGKVQDLDFAIELNEFNIDFFNPKYGIIDNESEEIYKKRGKPFLLDLKEGEELKWNDIRFVLVEYIAAPDFKPGYDMRNLAPAKAYFHVFENESIIDSGWVSCGNEFMPAKKLEFSKENSLMMANPEPSLFESDIKVYKKSGETFSSKISVNNPLGIGFYKIYQTSYEKTAQGYQSIFTIIYEPWLIFIYLGSFLMIGGALYLIFSRINLEKK